MPPEFVDAFGPDGPGVLRGQGVLLARRWCAGCTPRASAWTSAPAASWPWRCPPGLPPALITLHGNNKSAGRARARPSPPGSGTSWSDSFEEIARLRLPCADARRGRASAVLVRVTTGVEAHTHEFMATAHEDQKFGFSLAGGAADEAVRRVLALPSLEFAGLHSHIGSQIFDTAGFEVAAHRVIELAARIHAEHGVAWRSWTSAAGSGSPTRRRTTRRTVEVARAAAGDRGRAVRGRRPARAARSTVEPGRAIVGPSDGDAVRGGHHQGRGRPAHLRQRRRRDDATTSAPRCTTPPTPCVLASRASAAPPMLCRVVGRHCESGDIVVRDCLPARGPGARRPAGGGRDRRLLPVHGLELQHVPRPAVVAVADGGARVIVRRETMDDLLAPGRRERPRAAGRPTVGSARHRTARCRSPSARGGEPSWPRSRLKVALLGCGVVGSQVARLLTEQADGPGPCGSGRPARAGRDRGAAAGARRAPGSTAELLTTDADALVDPPGRGHRGRGDRRHRAGPVAAARRDEARQVGGHREQGAAGRARRGDARGGPRARRRPVLRGVRGRGDPAAAAAAGVAGRATRSTGCSASSTARPTSSWTGWTTPGADFADAAGGGAGARLRRGRPDRRRRGVRRRRQGGDPGRAGLPHPGHAPPTCTARASPR